MKILHYIPSLDCSSGGTTTYMQLLAKELGKSVGLHIATHFSTQQVPIENAQIHYLSASLLQIRRIKKQWQELLTTIRPDTVHVNCCWMPLCALTQKWSQQLGYKVILSTHGMLDPWIMKRNYITRKLPALWLYQKKAVKKADYIHATSELERDNLLQIGYNKNIAVIPNGVNVNNIEIKTCWKKNKTILYLSRIHHQKGIELLIQAIIQSKDAFNNYKFIIAGNGDEVYINSLKEVIQRAELITLFDFVGGVYGDKKWELFQKADIFVLPTYSECFGIVVAEALACGTPVITSKGTPWHELETHRCGWWIDNDVNTIAETLKEAIALSQEEYQQMGIRGRELIKNNYSIEIVAGKMTQLYKWILEEGKKPEFVYE
ncbi:MAG: glycosyltransferase [Candidatus Azobacteroides sp.]|nr:glycosyltransferase [Candidatus Azobacteroides sp.]